MAKNDDGVESELDTQNVVVEETDDIDVLKEKFEKVSEQNRQLYARTKKAEGFELKEGKWVKPKEKPKEPKVETELPKESSKPNELDYGQLALLRQEGIKGSGEMALFKEIMSETGKGVLDVLDSSYFKSRLNEFRQAQESANAVPKGRGRSGQTGATDVDMALAKYHETGELPTDFDTRNKVIDLITKEEKGAMFSGPSVIK